MESGYSGRCLCGGVRFRFDDVVEPPVACHCRECQRHSGGFWVAVTAFREAVEIMGSRLAWVSVSPKALRGFCRDCGGYLFWRPVEGETIDIAFGALDDPNGLRLAAHIYTEEARLPLPDDGVPKFPRGRDETE